MKMTIGKGLVSAALLGMSMLATVSGAGAEQGAINLKPGATMRDILTDHVGKRVAVRTDSGEEIEGTVTTVGDGLVHLSRLAGKDFFDSVVRIDRISSVRIRVRER